MIRLYWFLSFKPFHYQVLFKSFEYIKIMHWVWCFKGEKEIQLGHWYPSESERVNLKKMRM